jgi:PST family polysaccharide transporter
MDKVLKKNFSYLFLLQNANYIIPLIMLPYLAQVLGAENFGKINFAQAVISYFLLLTEFGFNVSSTKEIAKVQDDKYEVSKIFWNTIYAKILFASISFMILVLLIIFIPKLSSISSLLFSAFIGVASSILFPMWFFLGVEKMGFVTVLNVIPRILVLFLIFIFIKSQQDYLFALQIQVAGTLITALLSFFLIFQKNLVSFIRPNVQEIKHEIVNSWPIFVSSLATNLYTTTNIVVLGFLTNDAIVGIYAAADKIIKALITLLSAVTQVVFPRVNVYFIDSQEKALEFIKKIILIVATLTIAGGILLLILAPFIIKTLFGLKDFYSSILILRLNAFLPLFAAVNGIIAINVLVTFNLKKVLVKVVGLGGLFSLLLVFPLTYFLGPEGTAITAVGTEVMIFCLLLYELKKRNIYLFRFDRPLTLF